MRVLKTGQPEGREEAGGACPRTLFASTANFQAQGGVLKDRAPGKEEVFLRHVGEVFTFPGDGAPIDEDFPAAGFL